MRWKSGLFLVVVVLALLGTVTAGAAERWSVEEGTYVLAVTDKAGLLGALGHRHAVLGSTVEGEICYDQGEPAATCATFTVPTGSLVIDSDEGRELAELGDGPKANDVEEMQGDMLSDRYLAAQQHPEIVLTVTEVQVGREGPWKITADFSLHGTTGEVSFPMQVRSDGDELTADGSFTVKQTAYGIEPASVAGVVKVADPVEVRLHMVARATGEECEP